LGPIKGQGGQERGKGTAFPLGFFLNFSGLILLFLLFRKEKNKKKRKKIGAK